MIEILVCRGRSSTPSKKVRSYLVVLFPGLHPHIVGLVSGVLDGLWSVSPPQGLRGKLARGQVGGALLLHL